jgi:tRNA(Ile)-lysidine synthase
MQRERFAALLQSLGPFAASTHYAVALSGGADSLALTLLMQEYVAQHGGRLTTLTVDHRLRAESTDEAHHVASMMHARRIDHHILTPEHDDASNNLQESARNWRYTALSDYCRAHGILHCLVAHNAGDNRETAHHNITRGDTADGASGMRSVRNLNGVRFLRPLLTIERSELEDFLRGKNAEWIEDPSNKNETFARVRTRRMLQQNPDERSALDATITTACPARITRDHALAGAAIHCVTIHPLGFADIDLARWRTLDATLATQLLADCITTISGGTARPRGSDTERLADALRGAFTKRTLHHCELTVAGNILRIAREFARVAGPLILNGNDETHWDERFTIRHDIPTGTSYTLAALGNFGLRQAKARWGARADVPPATPALWHLDELVGLPHIELSHGATTHVSIGFSPPKPLAAAPFW